MKIFDPKKGGELVLPLPRSPDGGDREVMVLTLPPCVVSQEISAGPDSRVTTAIDLRGMGDGSAERKRLGAYEPTTLIVTRKFSSPVSPSQDEIQANDTVLSLSEMVKFLVNVSVTGPAACEVTLNLEVVGVPETYSDFIYRTMKK